MVPATDSPSTCTGTSTWTFSPLLDDDEVDVLDDLVHRVLLHVLDQGELALALDVELEHGVRLADEQRDLVAGEGDVLGVGAVAVDDGGDLAGGAEPAGGALAEVLAQFGEDLVVFVHGGSPCGLAAQIGCLAFRLERAASDMRWCVRKSREPGSTASITDAPPPALADGRASLAEVAGLPRERGRPRGESTSPFAGPRSLASRPRRRARRSRSSRPPRRRPAARAPRAGRRAATAA